LTTKFSDTFDNPETLVLEKTPKSTPPPQIRTTRFERETLSFQGNLSKPKPSDLSSKKRKIAPLSEAKSIATENVAPQRRVLKVPILKTSKG